MEQSFSWGGGLYTERRDTCCRCVAVGASAHAHERRPRTRYCILIGPRAMLLAWSTWLWVWTWLPRGYRRHRRLYILYCIVYSVHCRSPKIRLLFQPETQTLGPSGCLGLYCSARFSPGLSDCHGFHRDTATSSDVGIGLQTGQKENILRASPKTL